MTTDDEDVEAVPSIISDMVDACVTILNALSQVLGGGDCGDMNINVDLGGTTTGTSSTGDVTVNVDVGGITVEAKPCK
ncbi:hypothetical protein [Streptomyces syringium]|uniref:hypothetical protein n=1 Tax=Streptomyces syringium TaxID=76729 RepID=UPI0034091601